jgi:NADPH:quinone reductase-like Zn-dependent oxidoreductase
MPIQNKAAVIETIPVPELEQNDVLVKVDYVALNPTGEISKLR